MEEGKALPCPGGAAELTQPRGIREGFLEEEALKDGPEKSCQVPRGQEKQGGEWRPQPAGRGWSLSSSREGSGGRRGQGRTQPLRADTRRTFAVRGRSAPPGSEPGSPALRGRARATCWPVLTPLKPSHPHARALPAPKSRGLSSPLATLSVDTALSGQELPQARWGMASLLTFPGPAGGHFGRVPTAGRRGFTHSCQAGASSPPLPARRQVPHPCTLEGPPELGARTGSSKTPGGTDPQPAPSPGAYLPSTPLAPPPLGAEDQ